MEEQAQTTVDAQTFKCASCAARMEFKPGASSLTCPYCGRDNPIHKSEEAIEELDFHAFLAKAVDQEDTDEHQTVICKDCAAETSVDKDVISDECPFCGSPRVSPAHTSKQIKARSLLPFKVTRQEGRELFKKWINGLWFAPNRLKKMARQDSKLTGMYVPYWTYDSDTVSVYRGMRGEHYWETEHYTTTENGKTVQKTRQVRKTRWYPSSGKVAGSFDDILVLASNSLPKTYTERLEPWDLENLVGYKDEYLSGFRAESYHIDLEQGFGQARQIMDSRIREMVRCHIGGDEQQIHSVKTQHNNIAFKHILLPIWISAYRYGEKTYRFLVNARTGEVQGERPWSWVKSTLLVLGLAAAIGAVVAIVNANGGF